MPRRPSPDAPADPATGSDDILRRAHAAVPQPGRSDEDAAAWLEWYPAPSLPPSLSSPLVVQRILSGDLSSIRSGPVSPPEQVHSLRRAARNGDTITPEVEEAMRKAREDGNETPSSP